MAENPLRKLESFGQSVWLDFLRRGMLLSGDIYQLITEDGLSGMTSNPSIFEKAITGSHDYDEAISELVLQDKSAQQIYQALTIRDIVTAADLLRPQYELTQGKDGFISLELSPHLARNTDGSIAEARQLWTAVKRPNLLIKVPATLEGLPVIRQLISEGINVNITLLFGLPRYRMVADAYLDGLTARLAAGEPIDRIASVASFFLSRIDVLVDPLLEKLMREGFRQAEVAETLHGRVAIASAKIAYQQFRGIFAEERFRELAAHGARPQRLLWASTGTKNPAYSDVKYVEPLIGPETINTMPLETLHAFRDHGNPAPRLAEEVEQAMEVLQGLLELNIDIDDITRQLEDEGIEKFIKPYDQLLQALEQQREKIVGGVLDRQVFHLGTAQADVQARGAALEAEHFATRLWQKDATLWKTDPVAGQSIVQGLGWLHVAEKMEAHLRELSDFLAEVKEAGFRQVVLLGMGGSSLAPLVFQRTFSSTPNALPLTVLDTTDPQTIRRIADEVPLAQTLFIVASKSGTTTEPLAFGEFFYAQVQADKGEQAGENFVAITDPDTPLAQLARQRHFRRTFLNYPDIGGRYSALSFFGLLPASLMGVDVATLLTRAMRMAYACTSYVPTAQNPGMLLGVALGELALRGVNKVTFLMPEPMQALGLWLEQLLAESTGKEGAGLLPVANEPAGNPAAYGHDRLFIHFQLADHPDEQLDQRVAALQAAGHPVITIQLDDLLDLGQEFFRWEIATATAGSVLGINAFDQPNVQESKDNTTRLLDERRKSGRLPEEQAALSAPPLQLYASLAAGSLDETLTHFLALANEGDYLALLAFVSENDANERALQQLRLLLRDELRLATTLGYGPRYLHSTGQLHKGGPNTGIFLQLTCTAPTDVPIPEAAYTFATLRAAQALGDLQALRKHDRRVIRIDLGSDVAQGLSALRQTLERILRRGGQQRAA